ncbi:ABC transporter permease subunit [Listeria grandensis]|uniref:ABC transporter permease n=1 Tax=Listeria grandensis TaxID=1494963 RepID=UPI0016263436|nr:ABC transporter permease [Listeria grandensis]MBC1474109.1 ABC transporter permease subunit [Listeria grandensis]
MNLLAFESKKFLSTKKNIILMIFSLCLVVGNYLLITFFDDGAMQKNFYEMQASELANSVSELELIVKNEPAAKTALEITKKEADILNTQVNALRQENWQIFLKKQIEYDKLQLKGMDLGTIPLEESQIRDVHKAIALNTYLYENNLKPDIAGADKQGINYTYSFLATISPFILIALILLLTIDVLNSEKQHGTREFINTLPYSKWKIINTKIFIYIAYALLLIFSMGLLSFIIGTIFNGVGDFNYPLISQGISPEQLSILTISTWILKYLLFTFLLILLLTLLTTCISTLIYNDFIVLTISLILLFIPTVLSIYITAVQSHSEFFPIFYMNFNSLINGDTALLNSHLTYTNSLICFIVYSLVLYLILIFNILRRKKI